MAKEYNISRNAAVCAKCSQALQAGDEFVAALRETKDDFQRQDFCLPCWADQQAVQGDDLVGVWHSHVPLAQEKKKMFVDNDLLVNFFHRLQDAQEPSKISFRYVLALVLMRKKILVYDGMEKLPAGGAVWNMHARGIDKKLHVIDPGMDESKIAEVSQHLGEILEGEL
jgi:hypothetical protein